MKGMNCGRYLSKSGPVATVKVPAASIASSCTPAPPWVMVSTLSNVSMICKVGGSGREG